MKNGIPEGRPPITRDSGLPKPSMLSAFKKGGKVKPSAKKGGPEMARHNKLMHKGQTSKLKDGGKCYAKGGSVKLEKGGQKKTANPKGPKVGGKFSAKKMKADDTIRAFRSGFGRKADGMADGGRPKVLRRAQGGAAKLRKNVATPDGRAKKQQKGESIF